MKATVWELALAGGVGIVAGAIWAHHRMTTGAPAPPALPGAPPGQDVVNLNGGYSVTLSPNMGYISQALDVGAVVIVFLPQGARWVSQDGAPIGDRTSPQAFVFGGPISHSFVWTDAGNVTRTTVLDLSVVATVPTTTT